MNEKTLSHRLSVRFGSYESNDRSVVTYTVSKKLHARINEISKMFDINVSVLIHAATVQALINYNPFDSRPRTMLIRMELSDILDRLEKQKPNGYVPELKKKFLTVNHRG